MGSTWKLGKIDVKIENNVSPPKDQKKEEKK